MSGRERAIAALLLAIAVAGGASLPSVLSSAPGPLGIALAPGPGRSVVEAPAIPKQSHRATRSHPAAPVQVAAPTIPLRPGAQIALRPAAKPTTAPAKPTPAPPPPPTTTGSMNPPPPPATPPPASPPPAPPPRKPPPRTPTSARPGHGYGDRNHTHTGPPGKANRTALRPGPRSHHHDLRGSSHGRPLPQVPPVAVGAHHRALGRLATPSPAAASPGHEARAKARTKAGVSRGQGGGQPPPPVAATTFPAPVAAAPVPPPVEQGHGQSRANGHER